MIKELIKIADRLDRMGLTKEADILDDIFKKLAGLDEDEEYEEEDKSFRDLATRLLKSPEDVKEGELSNYQRVFQTANGSIYFIDEKGQSLRWKRSPFFSGELRETPYVMKYIYFINEETAKELSKFLIKDSYYGDDDKLPFTFSKEEFGLGVMPLEFGLLGFSRIVEIVSEEGNQVTIRLTGPWHIGNKIIKIYK